MKGGYAVETSVRHIADGLGLQVAEAGSGELVLALHGLGGFDAMGDWLERLASKHRIVAPMLPGFGGPDAPDWVNTVDDLALVVDDLVRNLQVDDVTLTGLSLGGWVAAELAVRRPGWLRRLVLVDALGIKTGPPDHRDIADLWAHGPDTLPGIFFHDVALGERHFTTAGVAVAELEERARFDEGVVRYGWEPYMHNPKLRSRLNRIDVPTLVVWGEDDRFVSPEYGREFAGAISGAEFVIVDDAGHLPEVEQPARLAEVIANFIGRHEIRSTTR